MCFCISISICLPYLCLFAFLSIDQTKKNQGVQTNEKDGQQTTPNVKVSDVATQKAEPAAKKKKETGKVSADGENVINKQTSAKAKKRSNNRKSKGGANKQEKIWTLMLPKCDENGNAIFPIHLDRGSFFLIL